MVDGQMLAFTPVTLHRALGVVRWDFGVGIDSAGTDRQPTQPFFRRSYSALTRTIKAANPRSPIQSSTWQLEIGSWGLLELGSWKLGVGLATPNDVGRQRRSACRWPTVERCLLERVRQRNQTRLRERRPRERHAGREWIRHHIVRRQESPGTVMLGYPALAGVPANLFADARIASYSA